MGTHAEPKNQQIEFDVFPKEKRQRNLYPFDAQNDVSRETTSINVVFSSQSVIVIIICAVLLLVTSFTLGVEKGKLIVKKGNQLAQVAQTSVVAPQINDLKTNDLIEKTPQAQINEETNKPEITNNVNVIETTASSVRKTNISTGRPVEIKKDISKAGYTIQIASLKTENSAKELSESLIKKGVPCFTRKSGEYVIVFSGNFKKKEDAQSEFTQLKKIYKDCFIRKI